MSEKVRATYEQVQKVLQSRKNGDLKWSDPTTRAAIKNLKRKYCDRTDYERISRSLTEAKREIKVNSKSSEHITLHLLITCRVITATGILAILCRPMAVQYLSGG